MAKKSFFEKLGLVESDEPVGAPEFESELHVCSGVGDHYINGDFPEDEQVQAEVPEGDTIDIEAVYNANNMNPADSVTVYKIKDVIDTFPSEMPTKTKRATVKNLMTTLGYDAAAIMSDAEQRKELLRAVGNDKMNALFDEMKSNDQQIESMKEQIEALTNRNVEAGAAIEKITNAVQDELKMISSIEEFIEEDKPEPAGKEGVQ
jgi:hypothetical protein|nr:MAG TPA: hypothetical protein [Caudoviricetes sp.]